MQMGDLSLPEYQGENSRRAPVQRGSVGFAAAILIAQGLPAGLVLARAIALAPSAPASHLLLPAALAAIPLGLACGGVGRSVRAGAGGRPAVVLAAGMAAGTAVTVACCLAGIPLGKVRGRPWGASPHLTSSVLIVAAGLPSFSSHAPLV